MERGWIDRTRDKNSITNCTRRGVGAVNLRREVCDRESQIRLLPHDQRRAAPAAPTLLHVDDPAVPWSDALFNLLVRGLSKPPGLCNSVTDG